MAEHEDLTTADVAELLGVHPSTVRRMVDAGELVPVDPDDGRGLRFDRRTVEHLAAARKAAT